MNQGFMINPGGSIGPISLFCSVSFEPFVAASEAGGNAGPTSGNDRAAAFGGRAGLIDDVPGSCTSPGGMAGPIEGPINFCRFELPWEHGGTTGPMRPRGGGPEGAMIRFFGI
jgi:hypothetical protein